ncbi:MAG TPA: hypothetical protein VGW98_10320 [Solirubrobacteraceae bacterium]|nr:hypothetical protein [Solirubrobacteraceae bacterium]
MSLGSFAVAMVACAFVLCGSALGETLWNVKGEQVKSAVTVFSKGTFKITSEQPKVLGGGRFTAECASSGEQTVGPGGEGEIKKRTLSGCKVVASTNPVCKTTSTITMEAIYLPWHTRLGSSEAGTRDYITQGPSKTEPGIELKCANITTNGIGNTSTAVKAVAGGVDETFDSSSGGFDKWSVGSGGIPEGTQLLENPSAGALTVERIGEWLVAQSPLRSRSEVSSSGSVRLMVNIASSFGGGSAEIACNESGKGTVGPAGEAEVTGMSLTGCEVIREVGSSHCRTNEKASVNAYSLPWHALLITQEGTTREYGWRSYEIKCDNNEITAYGTGNISLALETTAEGVNQSFSPAQSLEGGGAATSVRIEGNELLKKPGLEYGAGN